MLSNEISFSRRRSIAWAVDILNTAASLEKEEVDKHDSITIGSPPKSKQWISWQDVKGFVAATVFGENDDGNRSDADENEVDFASVVPNTRRSSTSSGMTIESISEAMKEIEDSCGGISHEPCLTLEEPLESSDIVAEHTEEQFGSRTSSTPTPLVTIKEDGVGTSSSLNLQTNPQDPPSRKRSSGKNPNKIDDVDWKIIQKMIKDKNVLTSAGVRNLVLDSLDKLPSADPSKNETRANESDPEMVKMREALARFTTTEMGRHPSMHAEPEGFFWRLVGRFMSGLSDECQSKW